MIRQVPPETAQLSPVIRPDCSATLTRAGAVTPVLGARRRGEPSPFQSLLWGHHALRAWNPSEVAWRVPGDETSRHCHRTCRLHVSALAGRPRPDPRTRRVPSRLPGATPGMPRTPARHLHQPMLRPVHGVRLSPGAATPSLILRAPLRAAAAMTPCRIGADRKTGRWWWWGSLSSPPSSASSSRGRTRAVMAAISPLPSPVEDKTRR